MTHCLTLTNSQSRYSDNGQHSCVRWVMVGDGMQLVRIIEGVVPRRHAAVCFVNDVCSLCDFRFRTTSITHGLGSKKAVVREVHCCWSLVKVFQTLLTIFNHNAKLRCKAYSTQTTLHTLSFLLRRQWYLAETLRKLHQSARGPKIDSGLPCQCLQWVADKSMVSYIH